MLQNADDRWGELRSGYRLRFDPRPALEKLESSSDPEAAWAILWAELYHQGDVDTAAYAAVPHIVRIHAARDLPEWNTYALLGVVESARQLERNPEIPAWLAPAYRAAWDRVVELALRDLARSREEDLVQSALGAIAVARGLRSAGQLLISFSAAELDEILSEYHDVAS